MSAHPAPTKVLYYGDNLAWLRYLRDAPIDAGDPVGAVLERRAVVAGCTDPDLRSPALSNRTRRDRPPVPPVPGGRRRDRHTLIAVQPWFVQRVCPTCDHVYTPGHYRAHLRGFLHRDRRGWWRSAPDEVAPSNLGGTDG